MFLIGWHSNKNFPSQSLTTSWMSFVVSNSSLNWTFTLGITKSRWRWTFLRLPSTHMEDIISFRWCLLVFAMPHPLSHSLMHKIFRPFLHNFVFLYFNDSSICIKTWEAHVEHVDIYLQLLKDNHLFLNCSKCTFGTSKVEYLGHIVGQGCE
jgi:hypothetical protein